MQLLTFVFHILFSFFLFANNSYGLDPHDIRSDTGIVNGTWYYNYAYGSLDCNANTRHDMNLCWYSTSWESVDLIHCYDHVRDNYSNIRNRIDDWTWDNCKSLNSSRGPFWVSHDRTMNRSFCINPNTNIVYMQVNGLNYMGICPSYSYWTGSKCTSVYGAEMTACRSKTASGGTDITTSNFITPFFRCKTGYEGVAKGTHNKYPDGACLTPCNTAGNFIRDMTTMECRCKDDYFFQDGACVYCPNNGNYKMITKDGKVSCVPTTCPANSTKNATTQQCHCNANYFEKVTSSGMQCIHCPPSQGFFQNGTCVNCPTADGRYFIIPSGSQLSCLYCDVRQGGTNYMVNNQCMSCIQNSYFDMNQRKCICNSGHKLNTTGSMCVAETRSDAALGEMQTCSATQYFDVSSRQCKCKAGFTGSTCRQCTETGKIFVESTNSCEVVDTTFNCPNGMVATNCKNDSTGKRICTCISACSQPRPTYDTNSKTCVCSTGKIHNGSCVNSCPDFYRPNPTTYLCYRPTCETGKTLIKNGDCITAGVSNNDGDSFSACSQDSDCNRGLMCYKLKDSNGKILSSLGYCVLKETTGKCNTNLDCRYGFVCVGGIGENQGMQDANNKGVCKPTIVLRQICMLIQIKNGIVARGTVALCLIALTASFLFGKMDYKPLIAFAIGVALIFGSFQVMYLITGDRYESCDLIDTITTDFLY